jgi:geranylgeranyl diphosphate synthase, type II
MKNVEELTAAGDTSMDATVKLEQELESALLGSLSDECPPGLAEAMRYAVFPGGARVRPKLSLAVARACGATKFGTAVAAAASLELLHCASLIHDDLPCFDDADYRRGKASVHIEFGERLAVLAGDALIVLAFEWLATRVQEPELLAPLLKIVAQTVGAPSGIAAGQAWECEKNRDLVQYQRAKTGALFAGCTMAGAAAAGHDPAAWRNLGYAIGEAFQIADDLRDVGGLSQELGKPTGQDAMNGIPNMVSTLGYDGATRRFDELLEDAVGLIPPCPGAGELGRQIVTASRALISGCKASRAA